MKTKPFNHQATTYEHSKDLIGYGIWWEQGTGKSKLLIDTICHLWASRKITGALIIAPNSVHANFVNQEMKTHWWDDVPFNALVYYSSLQHTKKGVQSITNLMMTENKCAVLVMSYDSIRTTKGELLAMQFLTKYEVIMALDESTAIAEPTSKQTKIIHKLGPQAKYRRVMSGTPMAEGPFKIYSPIKFIYPQFWKSKGLASYFVFKQTFAQFEQKYGAGGHQYQHLICYQNLPLLSSYIKDVSTRVLKEDVLDLPPKLYSTVEFEMAPKQAKMYETLKEEFRIAVDDEHTLEANTAMVRLMRLQQITSGFAVTQELPAPAVGDIACWTTEQGRFMCEIVEITPDRYALCDGRWEHHQPTELPWRECIHLDDPRLQRLISADPKTIDLFEKDNENPRLKALESILEPITHKVIIWARFKRDIDLICRSLGDAAVRFDGSVNNRDREIALSRFRQDPSIRYFVANPAAISMGVTLTQAKTVIYYSNTFQLEKRLQSEDRAHRIGQDVSVNIIDMVARGTVDEHIVATLRKKFDLAAIVNGDRFREWIQ